MIIHVRLISLIIAVSIGQLMVGQAQEIDQIQLGESQDLSDSIMWSGRITSKDDNAAVINVVMRSNKGINATSDIDGYFSIPLSRGKHTFTLTALGYADKMIELTAFSSANYSVTMSVENVLIDEVVIGDRAGNESIRAITPGVQRLGIQELENQSKFFGEIDVLRSLQSISGVSNTGEGASGFNVRGGNADQNLILQDGHLIFNPSHALGFFSLFHPDIVQHIDLYKGGIPAKYGGRTSSVLQVATRQGDRRQFKLKGGIGMVSSRLTLEGPIIKDKVSFIVASRYSYADWVFGLASNPDLDESKAFFNDVTANIDARLTPTTSLELSFLRSEDDFQFGSEARFDYSTQSASASLKQIIGDNLNLSLSGNRGRYISSLFDLKGNDQSMYTNKIDYTRAKLDALYAVSESFKLNAGAELNIYQISPGDIEPLIPQSIIIPRSLDQEKAREIAFYAEGQLSISNKIDISAGVRLTQFSNLGPDLVLVYSDDEIRTTRNVVDSLAFGEGEVIAEYAGLEPRASLRYQLADDASIKFGLARTYQYLAQISNTASATPIDVWQLSNQHIGPQYSDNISIGIFKNFVENKYETSLEVFYRDINGLIDYKDFAQLLMNDQIETELVTGIGQSHGVELNLNKKLGSFTWQANYTYSKSERRVAATTTQQGINNGAWFSSNYDIPHVLNLSLNSKFKNSSLSFNFTYRSGRPTTAPVSSYTNDNVLNIPIYSDRNQFRNPAFHRLDMAYTLGPYVKGDSWEHSITLSVYNVYARKNAYSVYFRQNPFESVKAIRLATLGTIFPSITFNFSLK